MGYIKTSYKFVGGCVAHRWEECLYNFLWHP